MRKVLIVGAGGFAREVFCWARDTFTEQDGYRIAGFLVDPEYATDERKLGAPIVGPIAGHRPTPGDGYVMGVGEPKDKLTILQKMDPAPDFLTLVHPTSIVGRNVRIGPGAVISPHCVLTCDIAIGRLVTLNLKVTVGHDATIGDFSTLSSHCDVMGYANIGKAVFLGSRAIVLPKARVEDEATVGAGAVVIRWVKHGTTVFGNPARPI